MHERPNPESAHHRQKITEERASRRRVGMFGMWLWSMVFAILTTANVSLVVFTGLRLSGFLLIELFFLGWCGCLFYLMGYEDYQRSKQPITDQEVEQRRQKERSQLFREAQGTLPMAYRTWRLVLESVLGFLLIAGGIALLVFVPPDNSDPLRIVYGIGLLAIGLVLLWSALYIKLRRVRYIPTWSARELQARLASGEMTEGKTKEDPPS